jgi:hypothetical protein
MRIRPVDFSTLFSMQPSINNAFREETPPSRTDSNSAINSDGISLTSKSWTPAPKTER